MKLRTKLVISFVTMIMIPTILTTAFIFGIARYQIGVIEHTYGITGEEYKDFAKSIRVLGDMPEIQQFIISACIAVVLILAFTAMIMMVWIYGSIISPIHKLQEAAQNVEEGNLNFEIKPEKDDEHAIEMMIKNGADLIFVTSPAMTIASVKMAIAHPDVKILNCSLNTSHKYIRTYYARMYEAKFLTGVLAGALATQNKIGYVAQYPVYGTVANINAFALGAKFVNPRARIYLKWSSVKGINIEEEFKKEDIHYISDQDMITPQCGSRRFGLYNNEGVGNRQHIAMPVWHWGVFYEKLIQSILGGSWKKDEDSDSGRALNYWWGMSSGVVDLICSNKVPVETRRLVELFRKVICNNEFEPFSDELYDQNRHLQNKKGHEMSPEDIITMDWLLDNVVGDIPAIDELDESARAIMVSQGITRE